MMLSDVDATKTAFPPEDEPDLFGRFGQAWTEVVSSLSSLYSTVKQKVSSLFTGSQDGGNNDLRAGEKTGHFSPALRMVGTTTFETLLQTCVYVCVYVFVGGWRLFFFSNTNWIRRRKKDPSL